MGLFIGCESELCEGVECGPGDCVEGICDCQDGYVGENCEIELCYGVECKNGDCDPQTEACICHPNYFGESCDVYCVNGEFINDSCNCEEGYEGVACETEIRYRFVGAWDVDEWTTAPQIGGSPSIGTLPGTIRFDEGFGIFGVELKGSFFSSGILHLTSEHKVVGQVTLNTVNFEFQTLSPQSPHTTVYGSASRDGRTLTVELFMYNPNTSLTEEIRGTFFKHHP